MKVRLVIRVASIAMLLIGIPVAFYFSGLWIPNSPDAAMFPVRGIDVSGHQGAIRWDTIPREQVRFAYIKATEGSDFNDSRFAANWKACAEAGIARGAYHFFTFKTDGVKQAAHFTAVVPNDPRALPPAIDLEVWGNSSVQPPVSEFQHELSAFISAVREFYGRDPVIYTTSDFRDRYLRDYPIERLWIRSVVTAPSLLAEHAWLFWQFSEKGRVRGITGFVDQNVFSGSREQLESIMRN